MLFNKGPAKQTPQQQKNSKIEFQFNNRAFKDFCNKYYYKFS